MRTISLLVTLSLGLCCNTGTQSRENSTETIVASPGVPPQQEKPVDQTRSERPKLFESVVATLRTKTKVPLRIPSYLATEHETQPLYALVEEVSKNDYKIELAFSPDCAGGNVCHYGFVSGKRISPDISHLKAQKIIIAGRLAGHFVEASCGSVCSDSTVSWIEDGYQYTVGLKAGSLETMKKVADSVFK